MQSDVMTTIAMGNTVARSQSFAQPLFTYWVGDTHSHEPCVEVPLAAEMSCIPQLHHLSPLLPDGPNNLNTFDILFYIL